MLTQYDCISVKTLKIHRCNFVYIKFFYTQKNISDRLFLVKKILNLNFGVIFLISTSY